MVKLLYQNVMPCVRSDCPCFVIIFSGPEELGSGSYGHEHTTSSGMGDDDSDYDIYIDEVT